MLDIFEHLYNNTKDMENHVKLLEEMLAFAKETGRGNYEIENKLSKYKAQIAKDKAALMKKGYTFEV